MGIRYKTDKPKWKHGKEMPLFSGKTWGELEDIWPREVRLSSDAYLILGLFAPAWLKTQAFIHLTFGGKRGIDSREFFLLCWLHRIEEANEGLAFRSWSAMKGLNVGGRLWYARKARLTKFGLIENLPHPVKRTYRITEMGKMVIKKFIDSLQEARDELHQNLATEGLYLHDKHIERKMRKFLTELNEKKDPGVDPSPD